jgi:AI-2 transport protein TqsA
VFGITAFLLNFVPSIGSIVATLLPLPIALVQYDSLWPVLGVLLLPGLVQIVVGNGVEPMVMGEGLELHPVTILLALMFWGLLWGIPGMLLAAPMTAVLRIVLVRIQTTRPVAELLAGRLPAAATVTP